MPLEKQPEDASGKPGLPVVGTVKASIDTVLSGEKPKNWSPKFRDFMVHYVGPEAEELTVGTKLTVITQNSEYTFIVTDNGLKAEDRVENRKIRGLEFDAFNSHYCLVQINGGAGTSSVRAIIPADTE